MNLEEKLKKQQYKEIWQQYCGFLDLSMDGYMKIQRRLMEEQVKLWSNCGLGQSILKGKHPKNLDAKYCFKHATCWLPDYTWEDVFHYTDEEIKKFDEIVHSMAHLIIEFSQEGGFDNASNF